MRAAPQHTPHWLQLDQPDEPGLLDLDWDALFLPEPSGNAVGPELPNAQALYEVLVHDVRPVPSGTVAQVIEEITQRLRAAWDLRRLILFGSHARGEATSRSDIDLLVELDSYTTAQHAVLGLYGTIGRTVPSVDILVARPEILAAYQGLEGSVYERALREGRVLFERPALSPATTRARG